jgi:nucleotide-binding universal stress UspA family protein
MTKKILCATDGSSHSEHAVQLAGELAGRLGVDMTVCVVNIARGSPRTPIIYSLEDAEVKNILDSAAGAARKAGGKNVTEVALRSRDAAAAVVQYAEENGYDHIICGTGDKHGVSRLVLGSVAAEIASRAHCTVTVAR